MKIPITYKNQILYCLIDDEDYKKINKYKWRADYNKSIKNFYVVSSKLLNNKKLYLHYLIIDKKDNYIIDHINGNRLDNRKCNLRHVTYSQNQMNSKKRNNKNNSKYSSKYKGVLKYIRNNQILPLKIWRAYININKKQISLGYFNTEKKAALAYNEAAIKYFGEYAYLNKIEEK